MAVKEKEWQPTEEQARHLAAFAQNGQHYLDQLNSLTEKYGGKFVAILHEKIVFDSTDQTELFEGLKTKYGEIPPDLYIVYIPSEHEILIA